VNTSQMFSHFHFRTNFIGSMLLPAITPAISDKPNPVSTEVFMT
jgi:hypothetical protein